MARHIWLGGTSAVAQVDTLTVGGTIEIGDKFKITLTDETGASATLTVSATSTSTSTTASEIATAFNASTDARFTPITALASTSTVTLTADTAGVPFHCTVTTTESDDSAADAQTFTRAATTANKGGSDFATAANWSGGSVPANGDEIEFNGRATADLLYSLDQSAKTFAVVLIKDSFASYDIGVVGGRRLKAGMTSLVIGDAAADGGTSGGSSCVNLNLHTVAFTARVKRTRNTGTDGQPPVQIMCNNNTGTLTVEGGVVGVGTDVASEAATLKQLTVRGGRVELGEGVSISGTNERLYQDGGEIVMRCGLAGNDSAIYQSDGTLTTEGSGAIFAAHIGGTLIANSTGTISTLEVKDKGVADFTQSSVARTVSAATIVGPSARIEADNGVPLSVAFAAGIDFVDGAKTTQANLGTEVNAAYTAA
jgi:hypothetical protein